MNHITESIEQYIRCKYLLCEYLYKTKNPSKLLYAVDEMDSLIDFLNIYLEMSGYISTNNGGNNKLLKSICKSRDEMCNSFKTLAEELLDSLDKMTSDTLINSNIPLIRSYVKFKMTANSEILWSDSGQLAEVADLFDSCYALVENEDLIELFENAVNELELNFKKQLMQLPHRWHQLISYHDRCVLEKEEIFQIKQENRHLIFDKMSGRDVNHNAQKSNEKGLWQILKNFLLPYELHAGSMSALKDTYLTQELDRYLFIRDMRMRLASKWGRTIPLAMNQYLIKFYNEPHYWDGNHLFLTDMDYMRLGFAYFQYAMELGNASEYTKITYRKALNCFNKSKTILPPELAGKLWAREEQAVMP